ncbi:hypothetical protein [Phreatobacter sp.]|uniref:hypothetical protein n=1 Tax=Phreatobacter sp. TaxID=1966341 RepID=UPI003F6FEF67
MSQPDPTPPAPGRRRPGKLPRLLMGLGLVLIVGVTAHRLLDDRLPACTSSRVERAALAFARDFGIAGPQMSDFRQVGETATRRDCLATVTNAAGASAAMSVQVYRDAEGRLRVGALPPRF